MDICTQRKRQGEETQQENNRMLEWKFTEIRNAAHCTHENTIRTMAIRTMSLEETLSYWREILKESSLAGEHRRKECWAPWFSFAVLLENNLARCKIQTTTLCSSITGELMFYLKLYFNRSSNTPGKRGMLNVYVSKFEILIISDSVLWLELWAPQQGCVTWLFSTLFQAFSTGGTAGKVQGWKEMLGVSSGRLPCLLCSWSLLLKRESSVTG